MNKHFYTLLSILLVTFGNGFAQSKMNLDEAVKYAITNHLSITNAQLGQIQAKKKINETRAIGLPQADAKVDFMKSIEVQSQFVPENAFNPLGDANKVSPLGFGVPFSSNASLTITQMLFNGSYFVGLEAAKTYKQLSDQNLEKTVEDVKVNVTKAYYGALVNKHRLALLVANKAQIEKLVSDAKVMVDAGIMETVDLAKLTISHNNLLTEIEKVESVIKISNNLLKYQMGMPLSEELELTESLEDVLLQIEIDKMPTYNIENRLDYKLLQTQLSLAELDLKNQKMVGVPSAGLFGQFGYNNGAILFDDLYKLDAWQGYAMVGAQLNIPIFSSGQNSSAIQQKKIEQKKIQNQIHMAQDGFKVEFDQYMDSYLIYQQSLERLGENLDLAQKVFENEQVKVQNGVGSNYDLIVAETSLKQAQTYYLGAVYDLLVTKVELDKILGNL